MFINIKIINFNSYQFNMYDISLIHTKPVHCFKKEKDLDLQN